MLNEGTLHVGAGLRFDLTSDRPGGPTLLQAGGALVADGRLVLDGGLFDFEAGDLTGDFSAFSARLYVSPDVRKDSRSLLVEAVVPNADGTLKPGLFATARIEQPARTPGILVPAASVHTIGGTGRVFVVSGDRVEERIVNTGQAVGDLVEITKGLKSGERVATRNVGKLADGLKVRP